MPTTDGDHQKLLTQVIQKQMVILGPDITLTKARNVKGLTIANDGTVTAMNGDPQELTRQLVEQFMELSGLIVKKTMEPLLASYPSLMAPIPPSAPQSPITPTTNQPQQIPTQITENSANPNIVT